MNIEARIGRFLATWNDIVTRHAWAVIAFFVLSAVGSLYYTVVNIGINTDTEDMLDEQLPYRQTLKAYKEAFPDHLNILLLVIDGDHPATVKAAAKRLAEQLAGETKTIKSVYLPGSSLFFDRNGLLYLGEAELRTLAEDLGRSSLLMSELKRNPTAAHLLNIVPMAAAASSADDQTGVMGSLLAELTQSLDAYLRDDRKPLQWGRVVPASATASATQVIVVQPVLDFSDLLAAGEAIEIIRGQARALEIDAAHGLRLRVSGDAALAYEEMVSVSQGMGTAGFMALILVMVILWFGTGSFRILVFAIFSLLVGLCLTAGFAAVSVGSLNLISVAFAVLYIGLGIDFSIHLSLRYEELLKQKVENLVALREAARDVGSSLVLCAVSTAIGFYAFIPTQFVGVSELGIISGSGMFISLFVSLTLLPALFSLWPIPVSKIEKFERRSVIGSWSSFPLRHGKPILLFTAVLAVGCVYLLPQVRFDYDLLNLRDQRSESVATFRDLVEEGSYSPLRLTVLADNKQEAERLRQALLVLSAVDQVISLESLLPENQQVKFGIIEELAQRLQIVTGARQEVGARSALADLMRADKGLQRVLGASSATENVGLRHLHEQLLALIVKLNGLPPAQQDQALQKLDTDLMGSYPAVLAKLELALTAEPVALSTLPETERARWVSARNQTHLLMVVASSNLRDVDALREFVRQVSDVADEVTDIPAISLAAGDAAVQAFQQAFVTAFILITLLLIVLLKSVKDAMLVLMPLSLAGLFTTAAAVLLDIPFNFANIIALPLLLGIGVDNGIHMVSRARSSHVSSRNLLQTSTARAVILSALTTVGSFGNLSYSSHPGTASMGQLLTIGVFITLLCTLIVLPVLLSWRFSRPTSG